MVKLKYNLLLSLSSSSRSQLDHQRSSRNDDDDDKLLDVVGPPQSPLLPLSHHLAQMHSHPHSGEFFKSKNYFY